jgi:hypothetical protein
MARPPHLFVSGQHVSQAQHATTPKKKPASQERSGTKYGTTREEIHANHAPIIKLRCRQGAVTITKTGLPVNEFDKNMTDSDDSRANNEEIATKCAYIDIDNKASK